MTKEQLKFFLQKCFLFDDVFQSVLTVFHCKAKFAICSVRNGAKADNVRVVELF